MGHCSWVVSLALVFEEQSITGSWCFSTSSRWKERFWSTVQLLPSIVFIWSNKCNCEKQGCPGRFYADSWLQDFAERHLASPATNFVDSEELLQYWLKHSERSFELFPQKTKQNKTRKWPAAATVLRAKRRQGGPAPVKQLSWDSRKVLWKIKINQWLPYATELTRAEFWCMYIYTIEWGAALIDPWSRAQVKHADSLYTTAASETEKSCQHNACQGIYMAQLLVAVFWGFSSHAIFKWSKIMVRFAYSFFGVSIKLSICFTWLKECRHWWCNSFGVELKDS